MSNLSPRTKFRIAALVGLGVYVYTQNPGEIFTTPPDDPSYDQLAEAFGSILYTASEKAVNNPDMTKQSLKVLETMLDSLNNRYDAHLKLAAKPNDISGALEVFRYLPQVAESTGISEQDLVKIASHSIDRMLRDIDPHGDYMTAGEYRELKLRMSGGREFGGFGFMLGKDKDTGYIRIRPYEDTPASKAGLQDYDLITHYNGAPVKDMTLREFLSISSGQIGESATLTIKREDAHFNVDIMREAIRRQNVTYRLLDGNVGYIKMELFGDNADAEIEEAVNALKDEAATSDQSLRSLILDLRGNPGGYVYQAANIADLFLDEGGITSLEGSKGTISSYEAERGTVIDNDVPLAVLTDGYSASASELLAGALVDNNRGTVIGLNSYGKGTSQSIITLNDGQAFKITTSYYLTPAGTSVQKDGIKPHIKVLPADTTKTARESDYKNVLKTPKALKSGHRTTEACDYKGTADFNTLSRTFRTLSGEPDAHLLCAIDYVRQETGDNGTGYTIRTPVPGANDAPRPTS